MKRSKKKILECQKAVEKIDPLLWKYALKAYRRLPRQTQCWYELEDVYEEARLEAIRCYFSEWDPSRGQFITFAFIAIRNRMGSLVSYWTAKQRLPGVQVQVETVEWGQKYREMDLTVDAVIQMMCENNI